MQSEGTSCAVCVAAATWPTVECLGYLREGDVAKVQYGKYLLMCAMEVELQHTFLSLAIYKVRGQLYVPSALTPQMPAKY
jgi:hypothetical protein